MYEDTFYQGKFRLRCSKLTVRAARGELSTLLSKPHDARCNSFASVMG